MHIDQMVSNNDAYILISADKFADKIKDILRDVLQEFKLSSTVLEDIGNQSNELLTRKQACLLLGISLPTLSKYVESGKLPFSKIGKKTFFDKDALLKACKVVKNK